MTILGVGLLIGGVAGLAIGRWLQPTKKVSADHGSVAVGGDVNAPVTITNNSTACPSNDSLFWKLWNIGCGIVSILGFALTLWPVHP